VTCIAKGIICIFQGSYDNSLKTIQRWGGLDEPDIDVISRELPSRGIYLNPVVPDADRAKALMNHVVNMA
jgi:hypothetical protein